VSYALGCRRAFAGRRQLFYLVVHVAEENASMLPSETEVSTALPATRLEYVLSVFCLSVLQRTRVTEMSAKTG